MKNAIRLTFVDVKNNQFVTLGGAAWKSKRQQFSAWVAIPSVPESDFIADLMDGCDIVADKQIEPEVVERLMGRPIAELIAAGREEVLHA